MDKEFYDKYSKDFECSCCQDLEHCINGKEPLKINCAIHYFKDKIAELETKLAESEKDIEEFKELAGGLREELIENDCMYKKEIAQLKQQLAEKEKKETKRMEDFEKRCQEYYSTDEYKRDFAIAELEQLKHNILTNQYDDGWLDEQVDIYELTEMIDQQIKSLKGDK